MSGVKLKVSLGENGYMLQHVDTLSHSAVPLKLSKHC